MCTKVLLFILREYKQKYKNIQNNNTVVYKQRREQKITFKRIIYWYYLFRSGKLQKMQKVINRFYR